MDWIQKMNAAVAYLEANLDGEIDFAEAGRRAGCSAYHFQRVFSCLAGTTPAEYVRRRRLTRAAFDLQGGGQKVIDVALRYGYDSPTSFARAFAALHGMPPGEAKAGRGSFVSYPPLSFQIIIKGVSAMNYRIEHRDAIRMVGAKLTTTTENDQQLTDITAFWQKFHASGKMEPLCRCMDGELQGVFGVCVPRGDKAMDYFIAVASSQPPPAGMEETVIPAADWAVFESRGPLPESIQEVTKRVYTEWLPTSGYTYADGPEMEVYPDGDTSAADYQCWVWLPVLKKPADLG